MLEGLLNFPNMANHLTLIGIYVILALSLNLINGSLGAFSLGHNAFWGMGAYVAGMLIWTTGSPEGSFFGFVGSLAAAMLAAAFFGLLVGIPCLRLRGDYLAIATLGFAEIFVICARNSEGWTVFNQERGLGGAAGFSLGDGFQGGNDFALSMTGSLNGRYLFYFAFTWTMVALTFITIRNVLRSAHGRAIESIREDETAAELLGVNLTHYKVLAFVIGAAFAGLAGALFANYRATVSPSQFLLMEGIKILLMAVLGGLGSMSGCVVAVFVLYVSEQALTTLAMHVPFLSFSTQGFELVDKPLKDLWQVIFSIILVLLMLLKPQGLMGRRELDRKYVHEILVSWKQDPILPSVTLLQWLLLLLTLALSASPLALLASIAVVVGLQVFKQKRRSFRVAAPAGGTQA